MKCYKPEKVNKDLPGIILLSHGPFAVSLVDTAKMLFGESENIAAYSLEPGDDIDKYREAFVPMLVNAVLAREGMSGKDFSLDTVENGKNGIFRVDTEGFLSDDDDEDDE